MNICFLINDISGTGGSEQATRLLANALSTNYPGYKITVASICQSVPLEAGVISKRVFLDSLFSTSQKVFHHPLKSINRIRSFCKQEDVDLLIDVDVVLDPISLLATAGLATKVIGWEHFNFKQNPDRGLRSITRKISGLFDAAIVVLTERDVAMYKSGLRRILCPIISIPNICDLNCGLIENYPTESKQIISCGRLVNVKGFDIAIRVASKVLPNNPGWTWTIFGEGQERNNLENMIESFGLQGKVFLPGRTNDMPSEYAKSAMYVMTSRAEGLPMVLLEARQHGLPIVSFNCDTGPEELVSNNVNGVLVEPLDINSMAREIDDLIKNKTKRVNLSLHSREGLEKYSGETVSSMWVQLFTRLCHG